jgi:hypothetical protein
VLTVTTAVEAIWLLHRVSRSWTLFYNVHFLKNAAGEKELVSLLTDRVVKGENLGF